jgi:polyisoprenoid-binding protein YceI
MRTLWVALGLWAATAGADVGSWQIDYPASHLGFTAEQAGAPFNGQVRSFEADVRFDPQRLSASHATVSIDMASVDTANPERDGILRGAGWFETDAFPRAEFVADDFVRTDDGFVAHGRLTIRSVTAPVEFTFTVTQQDGRSTLRGSAELDRFAFGLGLGDWANTEWVGQHVRIDVLLVGEPQ